MKCSDPDEGPDLAKLCSGDSCNEKNCCIKVNPCTTFPPGGTVAPGITVPPPKGAETTLAPILETVGKAFKDLGHLVKGDKTEKEEKEEKGEKPTLAPALKSVANAFKDLGKAMGFKNKNERLFDKSNGVAERPKESSSAMLALVAGFAMVAFAAVAYKRHRRRHAATREVMLELEDELSDGLEAAVE